MLDNNIVGVKWLLYGTTEKFPKKSKTKKSKKVFRKS